METKLETKRHMSIASRFVTMYLSWVRAHTEITFTCFELCFDLPPTGQRSLFETTPPNKSLVSTKFTDQNSPENKNIKRPHSWLEVSKREGIEHRVTIPCKRSFDFTWNPPDFMRISHEIWWITHEIRWISWNPWS